MEIELSVVEHEALKVLRKYVEEDKNLSLAFDENIDGELFSNSFDMCIQQEIVNVVAVAATITVLLNSLPPTMEFVSNAPAEAQDAYDVCVAMLSRIHRALGH